MNTDNMMPGATGATDGTGAHVSFHVSLSVYAAMSGRSIHTVRSQCQRGLLMSALFRDGQWLVAAFDMPTHRRRPRGRL